MNKNLVTFLTILLCLVLVASAAYAQEIKPRVKTENVIRLYQEELLSEVDIDAYLQSGEIKLLGGLELVPPKAIPGPAPDSYPHVHMWEAGIEQLADRRAGARRLVLLCGLHAGQLVDARRRSLEWLSQRVADHRAEERTAHARAAGREIAGRW